MADLKTVIWGLEISYTYLNVDDGNTLVPQQLVLDVLALLKAQKPRLVTEADFENADEYGFIPVWCEVMGNASDPFVIKDYWNCIPIDALETAKEDGCRYWTAKPSLNQREETPWE